MTRGGEQLRRAKSLAKSPLERKEREKRSDKEMRSSEVRLFTMSAPSVANSSVGIGFNSRPDWSTNLLRRAVHRRILAYQ
jgi:hypothetical protein